MSDEIQRIVTVYNEKGRSNIVFDSVATSETNPSQFVMALDSAAFDMGAEFAETTAHVIAEMRASEPLPGRKHVRLPSDGKATTAFERR